MCLTAGSSQAWGIPGRSIPTTATTSATGASTAWPGCTASTSRRRRSPPSAKAQCSGHPFVLIKPRTYVNKSGDAIVPALRKWKIDPSHLLIIYDDLDLPLGRIRIRPGGGDGGYKGLKSIIGSLGSRDFPRIRIGIGRPHISGEPSWEPEVVADWVLGDPTAQQAKTLQDAVSRAATAAEMIVAEGVEAAMNRYNK